MREVNLQVDQNIVCREGERIWVQMVKLIDDLIDWSDWAVRMSLRTTKGDSSVGQLQPHGVISLDGWFFLGEIEANETIKWIDLTKKV